MGYMSVFFFLNDCHGVIEKDPNFGKVIANTISAGYGKKYVDVQASSGQIALTRSDRLPADVPVDILYREGGVLLVKVK